MGIMKFSYPCVAYKYNLLHSIFFIFEATRKLGKKTPAPSLFSQNVFEIDLKLGPIRGENWLLTVNHCCKLNNWSELVTCGGAREPRERKSANSRLTIMILM